LKKLVNNELKLLKQGKAMQTQLDRRMKSFVLNIKQ